MKMNESREIQIADRIETMLRKDIFKDQRFEIRRDSPLIPRSTDGHRLALYVDEGPTLSSREIANVDALILNRDSAEVELLIEYEQNTNPKNLIGNFLAPFMADCYISKHSHDRRRYPLSKDTTCIILIVCLERPRGESNREQAPIQKGMIIRERLLGVSERLVESSNILKGDIIISDSLDDAEIKTRETIRGAVTK